MIPFFRSTFDHDELASTSDLARQLVLAGEVELPMVVRARQQTRGRGRGNHLWWSDPGSLTFTIAIDPSAHGLRRDHEPRLALAVAVGLIEVVEAMGPIGPVQIRWPNDIEFEGLKLGGILPERIETEFGPRVLIGIGLNVTTRLDTAPEAVRRMATSLCELGIGEWDAQAVLDSFLSECPRLLDRLAGDDPQLSAAWSGRDSLAGEVVRLDVGTSVLVGRGGGITATGGLILIGDGGTSLHHGGRVLRS